MEDTTQNNNFLKNKLEYIFKAVDFLHGRIQKSLIVQASILTIILAVGFYTEVSNIVLIPYLILSAIFLIVTLIPFLSSSSAAELKDNFEEISDAFQSSKLALHDAKQIKSGKELSAKAISKHVEFATQLTSLPDLSRDTLDNARSLVTLLNPVSLIMMAASQVSMYVQYVILTIASLIFIF